MPSADVIRKPLSEASATFEELYLKQDYKGAVQYLLENKKQFDSGIFHYNLGTMYSKMGDQAAARLHLEQAIQNGYINSASLNNLTFVKSQLQVDDLSNSISLPDQIVSTVTAIPASGYFSLTLLLLVIFTLLIRFKKIQTKWMMALVLILSLSPMVVSYFYVKDVNFAVALSDIAIYEGPSKIFHEKGKIRAGSKMVVGDIKDGWFYVEFPISLSGWVNKDQLVVY